MNFKIGPIGVARVSGIVPGSNATGAVSNAISNGANQMADMFFRQGAQAAEKAGLEQGSSIEQEKILAINPKTGEPVAYDPPQGFGTIAQDAYQRVVLSRFQTGIDQEIKLKAQELAVRHDGSVGRYTAAMSDYISAMTENADGQFKTYITDVGTAYLNATRSAMAIDQIRRERASAGSSLEASIAEGTNLLEFTFSNLGPYTPLDPSGFRDSPSVSNNALQGVMKGIKDGVTSGLISPQNGNKYAIEMQMAKTRGLLRFVANSDASSDELTRMKSAFETVNPAMIPKRFSYLADAMSSFGSNYNALADIEKFSSDMLGGAILGANAVEKERAAIVQGQSILAASTITADANASANAFTLLAINGSTPEVVDVTITEYKNKMAISSQLKREGQPEEAAAAAFAAESMIGATANGFFIKIFEGQTDTEVNAIEFAITNNKIDELPPELQATANAIISLEGVSPGIHDSFEAAANKYRSTKGQALREEEEAAQVVRDKIARGESVSAADIAIAEAYKNASEVKDFALNNPVPEVLQKVTNDFNIAMTDSSNFKRNEKPEEAEAAKLKANSIVSKTAEGFFIKLFNGTTDTQTDVIESAITNSKINDLPLEQRIIANAIVSLEGLSPGVLKDFAAFANDYRLRTGSALRDRQEVEAFSRAINMVSASELAFKKLPPDEIDAAFTSGVIKLTDLGLTSDNLNSLIKKLNHNAALAHLGQAFANPMGETRLIAVAKYLTTGLGGEVFDSAQRAELDKVREYTAVSNENANIGTEADDLIKAERDTAKQNLAAIDKQNLVDGIKRGTADGEKPEVRILADELFSANNGGLNAGTLVMGSPEGPGVVEALTNLANMTVLPESVRAAFVAASSGKLPAANAAYALRAWGNLRYTTDETTGREHMSPAIASSMKPEEIAKMEFMYGVSSLFAESPDRVQESMNLYNAYKGNNNFKASVEEFLGEPLDSYVANLPGIDGAMPSDVAAITGVVLGLVGAASVTQDSLDDITETVTKQIERSFPSDGSVINGYGGTNSRSSFSLTLGANAEVFQNFNLNRVIESGYTDAGEKIEDARIANLNDIDATPFGGGSTLGRFGGPSGKPPSSNMITFRPDGPPTDGNTSYTVMLWRSYADGGPIAVREKVVEGGFTFYRVMTANTKDPAFEKILKNAENVKIATANAEGQLLKDAMGKGMVYPYNNVSQPISLQNIDEISIDPLVNWFVGISASIAETANAAAARNDAANLAASEQYRSSALPPLSKERR